MNDIINIDAKILKEKNREQNNSHTNYSTNDCWM